MIRAYSQRLLPPYSGVVQIVDADSARAQSFDGVNWEIHYLSGADRARGGRNRDPGFALDRGYYNVASLRNGVLKTFILPAFLNPAEVGSASPSLSSFWPPPRCRSRLPICSNSGCWTGRTAARWP